MDKKYLDVRVLSLRDETDDIRSFELVPAHAGGQLPGWAPGAHIDICFSEHMVRSYSLCGSPAEPNRYRIAVKRLPDSRGGSRVMHILRAGDQIRITPPHGEFSLRDSASHHLLVAGGIGITPILSMFRSLNGRGASVDLHYFARSEEDAAFFHELDAARRCGMVHGHFGLSPVASRARLHTLFSACPADRKASMAVYCCAPAGLMQAVERTATGAGLDASQIFHERFAAQDIATVGQEGWNPVPARGRHDAPGLLRTLRTVSSEGQWAIGCTT